MANPTACAVFHPSIDRLSRVSPISKGKGKTRQGTLLPNKNDNHERSRRLEASAKEHRANMSLANRGQQQTMPTKLDPWGGTPELRRQISPRQLRATIEWGGLGWPAQTGFPAFSSPAQ